MTTAAATAATTAERLSALEAAGLNATIAWSVDRLAAEAERVEALPQRGPLHGMPVAVKDNIATLDEPTTCASRVLEGYTSPYEATVVTRLRAAGGLMAAKANLDEFAMGSSTEHSAWGRVHHPLDPARVPGGSSGGSAALVAAGAVPMALGSETGGSVRQPAAFCGVVGVKPTYGRVSRHGLVALASSLDCVSTFGTTVREAGTLLSVISGHDPLDATTLDAPSVSIPEARRDLRGVTIGLPAEYMGEVEAGVRAGVERAVGVLRELGAEVREVSLPHTMLAVPAYYVINPAEASSNLARYDGVRYGPRHVGPAGDLVSLYRATRGRGFGPEVRRRILVGTYVLSAGYYDAYYGRAQQARALIAQDFARVFASGVDLLFTPTTPTTAFLAGDRTADPVAMYLADVFVCPASLAGLPAMSLPIGRAEGLPVGGQLIAPPLGEDAMLSAALAIEGAVDATGEVR